MDTGKIRHIGEVWTMVMCCKCQTPFQVMNGRYPWQMPCPYCSTILELAHEPELKAVGKEDKNDEKDIIHSTFTSDLHVGVFPRSK